MSAPTPPATGGGGGAITPEDQSSLVLAFLTKKGYTRAALALTADIASENPANIAGGGKGVGLMDLIERNAPSAIKPPLGPGTPANAAQQQMKRKPDQSVAAGQLLADPPSWEKGYEGLRTFVENSLDIHRPELFPLLLPLFVHSYLDLVLVGYREAADQFLDRFKSDHSATDPHVIRMLSAIRLASHVSESEEATRWRQERYNVRLSERGWGLLLGWLQGGGLAGSIEGTEARGRDRVLAIINERVKVEAIPGPPAKSATDFGLLSDFLGRRAPKELDELKLGPAPLDPKLEREVTRLVKDEEGASAAASAQPLASTSSAAIPGPSASTTETAPEASTSTLPEIDIQLTQADGVVNPSAETAAHLVSPFPGELLPYPSTLRTIDVAREVEKVREARKRIKLGAEGFKNSDGRVVVAGDKNEALRSEVGKPSVCLFTVHDAGDSVITTSFSEDSTLMAAGFSESYIRVWNLTGAQMPGLENSSEANEVMDAGGLKRLRQKEAPTTRKLIGHSGPVYALSFDPVPGSSGPPRYLLSASQDTTVRLWSLETYTNLVAYRGHREPVWDVQWGPKGIYFATASRDRTARLWATDKVSALRIFAGHLSDVNCVRFHPNSLYLATGSSDRTCRLWDVQKGTCVRVFVGHRGSVSTLAISPDGRYLASAAEDFTIILWDLAAGRKVKSMTGHTSSIYSLAFSAESSVLISGSADATVRVWDVLFVPPISTSASDLSRKYGGGQNETAAAIAAVRRLSTTGLGEGAFRVGAAGEGASSGKGEKEPSETLDLLVTLATKRTPVFDVHVTQRNLVMAAGVLE